MIMDSNEGITSRNEPETIRLTEADIPGAKLTGPMDGHTIAELKWWLLCRGIKVPNSWNKKPSGGLSYNDLAAKYISLYFTRVCLRNKNTMKTTEVMAWYKLTPKEHS